jgi:hypothetical protein
VIAAFLLDHYYVHFGLALFLGRRFDDLIRWAAFWH